MTAPRVRRAEVRLPTPDLDAEMRFFVDGLGFRLERIGPADNPVYAGISGHGVSLILERSDERAPVVIRCQAEAGRKAGGLVSPGGHRIAFEPWNPPLRVPAPRSRFQVTRRRDGASWDAGRVGMLYRDLIPDRLGGAIIASHIRIPDGGAVPDQVHYHTVGFQLIFCHRGWVRIVYEEQGPPFVLEAGDCVIQPPEIRHRVLEASAGLEVVEVGSPAEHRTSIDHEMELPTPHQRPDRDFQGTRFVRHRAAGAKWKPFRIPGFEQRETGIGAATGGIAAVRVARRIPGPPAPESRHDASILFGFLRQGSMDLRVAGESAAELSEGDAFVLPPHRTVVIRDPTDDLEILEVALPAGFRTEVGQSA